MRISLVTLLIGALSFSLSSIAKSSDNWYLGFGIGSGGYSDNTSDLLDDMSAYHFSYGEIAMYGEAQQNPSSVLNLYVGRWFSDTQGYEFGYLSIDKVQVDGETAGSTLAIRYDIDGSSDVMYASYLMAKQYSNQSRFYGKLGIYQATTNEKLVISGRDTGIVVATDSVNSSVTGLLVGLGYNYEMSDSLGLRVNFDFLPSAIKGDYFEGSASVLGLSLNYQFK